MQVFALLVAQLAALAYLFLSVIHAQVENTFKEINVFLHVLMGHSGILSQAPASLARVLVLNVLWRLQIAQNVLAHNYNFKTNVLLPAQVCTSRSMGLVSHVLIV